MKAYVEYITVGLGYVYRKIKKPTLKEIIYDALDKESRTIGRMYICEHTHKTNDEFKFILLNKERI